MKRSKALTQPRLILTGIGHSSGAGGLHSAARKLFFVSRLFGLLPVAGLLEPVSWKIRCDFKSPYMVIYCLSLLGHLLVCGLNAYDIINIGVTLSSSTNFLFYLCALVSSFILTNISINWSEVLRKVEALEAHLPPLNRNIATYCNLVMIFVLALAVVEHLFSLYFGWSVARHCSNNTDIFETFYQCIIPWASHNFPYTEWRLFLYEIINGQSTFLWTFNDLIIMVMSIYLSEHLLKHNYLIKIAIEQPIFPVEMQSQYTKIVKLVDIINEQFGPILVLALGSNLYWLCLQLFHSLQKNHNGMVFSCLDKQTSAQVFQSTEHTVYFVYSVAFLIVRTVMLLLLAARIHTLSKLPLRMLYSVSSTKYNKELERFIDQINNTRVALSGLGFFHVTRRMILSVTATIVTYELVLLQYYKN